YAYFTTLDSLLHPQYPYVIGPVYHGYPFPADTGFGSGHDTITETVTVYYPIAVNEIDNPHAMILYPNPASNLVQIDCTSFQKNTVITIVNSRGEVIVESAKKNRDQITIDTSTFPSGIYFVKADGVVQAE